MDGLSGYQIEVQGRVDVHGLNEAGPLQVFLLRADEASTGFSVRTDQSGLIGLLRHLHGRGAVLITVRREDPTPTPPQNHDEDFC